MNKSARTLAASGFILAFFLALATLALPKPSDVSLAVFRPLCIITAVMLVGHLDGALLFALGLRGFTVRLRAAYGWLVAGFVLLAISFLQLPLLSIFHWDNSAWSTYGFIAVPFVGSIVSIYVGARGFSRLFGVKSILTSAWGATGLAVVCAALAALLPNATPNKDITYAAIQFSKFAVGLPAFFTVWAAVLAYKARKQAGPLYVPALTWLTLYLVLDSVGSVAGVIARLVQPGDNFAFNAGYMYVLYAVSGLILLKAALEFVMISAGKVSALAVAEAAMGVPQRASSGDTLVDIVVYTAALTANVHAVDPILDNLRLLTAGHDRTKPYDDAEQRRLAQTYLSLETYLAEQEPVRRVTREDLRHSVAKRFDHLLHQNSVFAKAIFG